MIYYYLNSAVTVHKETVHFCPARQILLIFSEAGRPNSLRSLSHHIFFSFAYISPFQQLLFRTVNETRFQEIYVQLKMNYIIDVRCF